MSASRYRLFVAYDGTDFVGWQRQASGTSIQALLEDALSELEEGPVTVLGAGRTDAGVHVCTWHIARWKPSVACLSC